MTDIEPNGSAYSLLSRAQLGRALSEKMTHEEMIELRRRVEDADDLIEDLRELGRE